MTKTNIQKHIRPRKENNITHHVSYEKFFQMKKIIVEIIKRGKSNHEENIIFNKKLEFLKIKLTPLYVNTCDIIEKHGISN